MRQSAWISRRLLLTSPLAAPALALPLAAPALALPLAAPALALPLAAPALAQAPWPEKPLRFVVPFPPGSISDAVARLVAERLAPVLGQRVLIDNRGGAAGNIGSAHVAHEAADGYTFLVCSSGTHGANPALYRSVGYDPVRDFTAVCGMIRVPNVLVVRNALPVRDVAGFIALAKAEAGKLTYGSIGNGSSQHLAGTLFEQVAGVRLTHVPYRAVPPLLVDMQSDRLDASFQLVSNVVEQILAGQIRALAVTVDHRVPALASIPTMAEAGVAGYETAGWFGLLAPAQTPTPIVARLAQAVAAILAAPDMQQRLLALGTEPMPLGPAEFGAFIRAELPRWAAIVQRSGAQVD